MKTIDKLKRRMVREVITGYASEYLPTGVNKDDLMSLLGLAQSLEFTSEDVSNRVKGINKDLRTNKEELSEDEVYRMEGIRFALVKIGDAMHKVDVGIERRINPKELSNTIPDVFMVDEKIADIVHIWRLQGVPIEEIQNRLWKNEITLARTNY